MSHEGFTGRPDFSPPSEAVVSNPIPVQETTPHMLNSRLSRLQRRLPTEAAAIPLIGAASIPLANLALTADWGTDPKMFAAMIAFKIACLAGAGGAIVGAARAGKQTVIDLRERTNILDTAREGGYQVGGTIFKRVGP